MKNNQSRFTRRQGLQAAAAAGLLFGAAGLQAAEPEGKTMRVYIGTYTGAESKGIYLFELDVASGKLTKVGLAGEVVNPSFLALHPTKPFLYAVSETAATNGKKAGAVSALAVDPATGLLKTINQQLAGGTGPCHVSIDRTGKSVLVANYGSGSCGALPVKEDGSLGEMKGFSQHAGSSANPGRQKEPHAHSINVDPGNHFAFCADLGCDKIFVYKLKAETAELTPNEPAFAAVKPGSGPRHFAFDPTAKHAYVINELTSTITGFQYDAGAGKLTEIETISTLPLDYKGNNSTAEIQVHPSGKFVYGSNRGHNSIAVFARDPESGRLTFVEHQGHQIKTPRNFGIDPTGSILIAASQDGDQLTVFKTDSSSGKLTPVGEPVPCPKPVCVKFAAKP